MNKKTLQASLEADAANLQTEVVKIKGVGSFTVSEMNGHSRDLYDASICVLDKEGKAVFQREDMRAKMVVCCLLNEEGKRMYTEPDDYKKVSLFRSSTLNKLYNACAKLNEMDVEEKAKN